MIPLLTFFALIGARSTQQTQVQPRTHGIKWSSCPPGLNVGDPSNGTYQCGTLDVPLDYTDKSSDTKLSLDIIKIPALHGPKAGSIFFNWGGPGGDGLTNMAASYPAVRK